MRQIILLTTQPHGIPYKYEFPIELQGWNRKVTIYPDFTVLNKRTGKMWIMEHLGMMDNSNYLESTMQKLDTYEKNNILLGRDLIQRKNSSQLFFTKCLFYRMIR